MTEGELVAGTTTEDNSGSIRPALPREDDSAATEVQVAGLAEAEGLSETSFGSLAATLSREVSVGETIGEYELQAELGRGGYGRVLKAWDTKRQQHVALKLVRRDRLKPGKSLPSMLEEARRAPKVSHPGIVRIESHFEHGGEEVLVMEYIDGEDLSRHLKRRAGGRFSVDEAVRVIRQLCEIVQSLHEQRCFHRDLKPQNVLLDSNGVVHLVDFGLLLHDFERGTREGIAGTPMYMSPEQMLGETHRVDGRTDIWSLGVILYELLSGELPFGGSRQDVMSLLRKPDARAMALRQRDASLPEGLSRICDKCLRWSVDSRYSSAAALLDDLNSWERLSAAESDGGSDVKSAVSAGLLATDADGRGPESAGLTTRVRARGLQSYNESDRGYFLRLLPGDVEPDGLPESIHFWLDKLGAGDVGFSSAADGTGPGRVELAETFSVGLIHGRSGCGKSSFVKAGLLPLLPDDMDSVYLEASAEQTESNLATELRRRYVGIPSDLSLAAIFRGIREGEWLSRERRLLIVLDQFEQWLDERGHEGGEDLRDALRQCLGGRLQVILLVREEYWTATEDFMVRQLRVPLDTRWNAQLLPLFGTRHARRVLGMFGQWHQQLSAVELDWSEEQREFLKEAVEGLAQRGEVVPVRLAVLSEMFREQEWSAARLRSLGGAAGVGTRFLEQQFSPPHAPARHSRHLQAAQLLLEALLPPRDKEIRGHQRSIVQLRNDCGYGEKGESFAELLRILEVDLKLITRSDGVDEGAGRVRETCFMLTHDFLVPSVREWVSGELQRTATGRATLMLRERDRLYSATRDRHQLPAATEWLQIRWRTDRGRWTASQRKLMQIAGRMHGRRWGGVFLGLSVVIGTLSAVFFLSRLEAERNLIQQTLDTLKTSSGAAVALNIERLGRGERPSVVAELQRRYRKATESQEKLNLAFALAEFDFGFSGGVPVVEYLVSQADGLKPEETGNLLRALRQGRWRSLERLEAEWKRCEKVGAYRRRSSLALTALGLGDVELAAKIMEDAAPKDYGIRTEFIDKFADWQFDLSELSEDLQRSRSQGFCAAVILGLGQKPEVEIDKGDLDALVRLMESWLLESPDSAVHGAAKWLLRKWKPKSVSEAKWRSATEQVSVGRNWFVNTVGTTMVLVKPDVELARPAFWIASTETSRGNFEKFIKATGEQREVWNSVEFLSASPSDKHPMVNVTWFDAARYCNWLSVQEGRSKAYRIPESGGLEEGPWELIESADGYRLPLEWEWEVACRAGSKTKWSMGDDQSFLAAYGQVLSEQSQSTEVCGSRLPNAWGLHDFHGNVQEWCSDGTGVLPQLKGIRGGAWDVVAAACASTGRSEDRPDGFTTRTGFRVALKAVEK